MSDDEYFNLIDTVLAVYIDRFKNVDDKRFLPLIKTMLQLRIETLRRLK